MLLPGALQAGMSACLLWASKSRLLRQVLGMPLSLLVWELLVRGLWQPPNGR
jgi:hypothetical protein